MYQRIRALIINLISLPLYWISFFTPRNKNIWVFGAWLGRSYTDNSKWLFESVCKNEPQIRAIWLTRERKVVNEMHRYGFEVYMIKSWKGYWLTCRAGLAIACWGNADVNRIAISRAKKLQLWHGSPMKQIVMDDKYAQIDTSSLLGLLQKIWQAFFPFTVERWDVVIACSEVFKRYMASAFGVSPLQVKVTGYPRNDVLLDPNPPIIPFIEELKKSLVVKYVLIYAPTFRNDPKDMDKLFHTFEVEKFESFLTDHEAVLLIKMHYVYLNSPQVINLKERISRICWLDEKSVPEINPLLNFTDILITDYSGVYFDYLLLDRPVVFAPFDLENYLAGDREMYEDYNHVAMAGPKCRDWNDVMKACQEILNGNDKCRVERKAAQRKYNSFVDANSCSRVIEVGKNMVGIQ
ncbi:MAG: CDP-glycerol glycerophosphotransferase family protein [Deltaproteobacteria bacterium]|nr:CDP-glycerol glycerophosphotransferase family protein [Deltaproteobacteria bacterium]